LGITAAEGIVSVELVVTVADWRRDASFVRVTFAPMARDSAGAVKVPIVIVPVTFVTTPGVTVKAPGKVKKPVPVFEKVRVSSAVPVSSATV